MKKLFTIILFFFLTLTLFSCTVIDDNSSVGSDNEQTLPAIETTTSSDTTHNPDTTTKPTTDKITYPEPSPDPEPVIDMDELYLKVFENQSKCYTLADAPNLEYLDRSKEPMIVYLCAFDPEVHVIENRIWVVEGVTSKFANGLLDKYTICSYNYSPSVPYYYDVQGYYHTAYLDVLFENVTFKKIDKIPTVFELTRLAAINGDENNPDRYYYAYEDMKLYYEENGAAYRSVQNVDAPYLHMMARNYIYQHLQLPGATPKPIMVINTDPDEEGTPKKVFCKTSNGETIEYSIYPNGKVYSQVFETYSELGANPRTGICYLGEFRSYFPTEELFRTINEGKITE